MKKIAAKIKNIWRRVSSLLAPEILSGVAGLLGPRPAFRPIPVRSERIYRRKK